MIKDVEYRDELLAQFPKITYEDREEIQNEYMPQYVIYTQVKKGMFECYCTHCGRFYTDSKYNRTYSVGIGHKQSGTCLECGHSITYLASGRGRKGIRNERNFAVFKALDDKLFIECLNVREKFSIDGIRGTFEETDPLDFVYYKTDRYCITREGAQHWKRAYWESGWSPSKSESEPSFALGRFGYCGSYTIINEDETSKTFLKYADNCIRGAELNTYNDLTEYRISYYCEFAVHPNIEYLIKTGYGYIIADKLTGKGINGIRINYKSNDVKKMLKLNKNEMKVFADKNCKMLSNYLMLRRIDSTLTSEEQIRISQYSSAVIEKLIKICERTGLTLRKVTNYLKNHGDLYNVYEWKDYLDQCGKLGYNLSDTAISKPKSLAKAHERLTKIIKIKADEIAQKALERRNKVLEKMKYVNKDKGLQIILPKSVQEIIDEGKRLNHCVGGYVDRHANGKLTILFLRTIKKPNVPYYTMEVDNSGNIVQCRGFKNNRANNPKPQIIKDFENEYQQYLNVLFKKKGRKSA